MLQNWPHNEYKKTGDNVEDNETHKKIRLHPCGRLD